MNIPLVNFTHPDDITIVCFVIKSAQGTTPGPADAISYTLLVNKPGGGTVEMAGVKPSNQRPTAADIDAAKPGTVGLGAIIGGNLYATIIEQYAGGGCP